MNPVRISNPASADWLRNLSGKSFGGTLFCVVCAGVLAFPEALPASLSRVPQLVAVLSLVWGALMVIGGPVQRVAMLALAISIAWGGRYSANDAPALNHFTTACLGFWIMAAVSRFAHSSIQVRRATLGLMLLSLVGVVGGVLTTDPTGGVGPRFMDLGIRLETVTRYRLPGMRAAANQTVVALLALTTIPPLLLIHFGELPVRRRAWNAFRTVAIVLCVVLILVVQSLSVLLAALAVIGLGIVVKGEGRSPLVIGAALVVGLLALAVSMARDFDLRISPLVTEGLSEIATDATGVRQFNETRTSRTHEIRSRLALPRGPYRVTATIRARGVEACLLFGGWYTRYDFATGDSDDLGQSVSKVEALDNGWLRLSFVATNPRQDQITYGVRVLSPYPEGESYDGQAHRGIELRELAVQLPRNPLQKIRLAAELAQASMVRSLRSRIDIWKKAFAVAWASPLGGIGFGRTRLRGLPVHAHNMLLQLWLDLGLIGATVWCASVLILLGRTVRAELTTPADSVVPALLMVVIYLVFGLFDAIPIGAKVGLIYWGALGLLVGNCSRLSGHGARPLYKNGLHAPS